MNDKEKKIQEKRLIEATQKNFMGKSGKLACILKFMGSEIISETGRFYSSTELDDPYYLESGEQDDDFFIHEADEGTDPHLIGHLFSGLNRGVHLEIKHFNEDSSYLVEYKGFPVFHEKSGELERYAPFPEWEDRIEEFYLVAKRIADKYRKTEEIKETKRVESEFVRKIKELRLRWNI